MARNGHPMVVDADAHVIETERTWDYLEGSDKKFRPVLFGSAEMDRQYWVLDGKIRGVRLPTLNEQQLDELSGKTGRRLTTPQASRQLDDVDLRLSQLDELGVDVQVMHNTLWIERGGRTRRTPRPRYAVPGTAGWPTSGRPARGGSGTPASSRPWPWTRRWSRCASPGRTARWRCACGPSRATGTWWTRISIRCSSWPRSWTWPSACTSPTAAARCCRSSARATTAPAASGRSGCPR